jgi:hypothetical protein
VDAVAQLAALEATRAEASGKVDAIEREARQAGQQLAQAREQLAELERRGGGRQSDRAKAEVALVEAERGASQSVWVARVDGAKRRVRDADIAVAEHVRSNLAALLRELEAEARVVAAAEDRAALDFVEANYACQQIAARLGGVLGRVRRPEVGDVSFLRGDELARQARAFLDAGGEEPPAVARDREPWASILAAAQTEPETEAA